MWRPPERIRHQVRPGRWPTADEAAASRLFSPLRLGPLELRHRTWVPAMVPWRATEDGHVTDAVIDWYRRFAAGRPAALVVEATGIRDIPSGPLLRIGDDRFLPGLESLVRAVRRASGGETRLFIQLIDFLTIRRRPDPEKFFRRYLTITRRHRQALGMPDDAPEAAVRTRLLALSDTARREILDARERESLERGYRERVTDMHLPHIADLPQALPELFATAAVRARKAGFDGVELHYAHAYTMASFLSALNDRPDGYGGTRENRVRLPLEVYRAVRAATGDDFVVGCRFLAEECIPGGSTLADAVAFGAAFAAAGMDFLSLSRGGKFEDAAQPRVGEAAYPYTGPSGYECMPSFISDAQGPFGRNLEPAARVRAAVREAGHETPVVVTGGIHGFAQAEAILAAGRADIIGFARQALADPDWFRKVRAGRGAEVRLCTYSNYCEALDQKHKEVTCKLWDRVGLDAPGVKKTADGKRRLTAPAWDEKDTVRA
ncbi:MAG: NADH:flavin oxidoreductase [Alphaproteobacteria bacterium]|nr:MAG: NADH:flavin oxidoreductase [Alphaproteobacteria bacterium]